MRGKREMENFKQNDVQFEYDLNHGLGIEKVKALEKYIIKLNNVFKKETKNFVETCVCVYKIKEIFNQYYSNWVYDKQRHMLRFDDIMTGFGIDQTQSSRLIACYEKYIDCESEEETILSPFAPFSKSKLFELLVVDTNQILHDINNNVLRPDMTVKAIRDYANNYKAQQKAKQRLADGIEDAPKEDKPEEIDESTIPMAYMPNNEYPFSYFETKTKSQLLNMIWDLQKEYQKLKKEKQKNGKDRKIA